MTAILSSKRKWYVHHMTLECISYGLLSHTLMLENWQKHYSQWFEWHAGKQIWGFSFLGQLLLKRPIILVLQSNFKTIRERNMKVFRDNITALLIAFRWITMSLSIKMSSTFMKFMRKIPPVSPSFYNFRTPSFILFLHREQMWAFSRGSRHVAYFTTICLCTHISPLGLFIW